MRAKLISKWGATRGSEHTIGAEATIGRGRENTIRIEAKPVSSRHARIFFDRDRERYCVEDLGSLNGTRLDGIAIARAEPLERLHVLEFGGVAEFLFVGVDRSVDSEPAETTATADGSPEASDASRTRIDAEIPELPEALRGEAKETSKPDGATDAGTTRIEELPVALPESLGTVGAAGERAELELPQRLLLAVTTPGGTRRFELAEGENVVGRSMRAAIRLSERDLSRRHAALTLQAGRVTVRDLGSRNKTLVGGEAIEGEVELQPGDVVLFGAIEARLLTESAGDTLPPPPASGAGDDGG